MSGGYPRLAGIDNNNGKFTATIFVRDGKSQEVAMSAFNSIGENTNSVIGSRDNVTIWYPTNKEAAAVQQMLETWFMMDPDWWDRLNITPYSPKQWKQRKKIVSLFREQFRRLGGAKPSFYGSQIIPIYEPQKKRGRWVPEVSEQ